MTNFSNGPLVSIIITNYNKANFLLDCIKSCINQSYKNKEIIFFDDKSTDNSLKKIKNFKVKNNHKFKIITNSKKKKNFATYNHISAINKCLLKAKGKYIFLLDSDDYFHHDKLKKVIKIFEKNRTYKFVLDQPIFKYKKKGVKKYYKYNFSKNKWPKFPPTSCMCFEKNTLKKVFNKISFKRFPNLAIDFRLAVYYSLILKKFFILNSHYTLYRQINDSMDSRYVKFRSKEWWIRREEAFEFLNLILKKNNLPINKSLDFFVTKFFNKIMNI